MESKWWTGWGQFGCAGLDAHGWRADRIHANEMRCPIFDSKVEASLSHGRSAVGLMVHHEVTCGKVMASEKGLPRSQMKRNRSLTLPREAKYEGEEV